VNCRPGWKHPGRFQLTSTGADIARSAALLIKQRGEEAWAEAAVKYFEMKESGDEEGMRVWRLIARLNGQMTGAKPSNTLH